MRIKLKIKQKIVLFVLSTSIILYLIAIGYIVSSSRKAMLDDAKINAQQIARISADKIEKNFERDLAITRTLAQAFSIYQQLPTEQWQDLFMKMYRPVLEGNKHVYSIWDSWEFYGFVPNYTKDYGRFCITLWRENDEILSITDIRSPDGDPDKYGAFKKGNQEGLWEPYFDEGVQGKSERVLMTTISSPVQIGGKYFGLVGFDVSLESLQQVITEIKPVQGSFAFLVSAKGTIAAHPNSEFINVPLSEVYPEDFENEKLSEIIQDGKEHSYYRIDENGRQHYMSLAPIKAGNSYSSWSLVLSIPLDVITEKADESLIISLIVGAGGLLLLALILIFIANNLTRPIVNITKSLTRLSHGEISDDLLFKVKSGDEIEVMANALNISIEGLNKKSKFATDIGKGQLESTLDLLGEDDELGKSLLNMRNSLKKAKEEESNRLVEDKKRTWANEGFALFADIMRQNNDNLEHLCDEFTKNIVKYIEANQGALFLLNNEDKNQQFLELQSTYAWDRKKHMQMQFMLGEGLVGACALEGETILLTDIPDEYITINSGLGEANPNCILIVPLKQEDKALGVIEVASFKIFEQFEVDFLEKVAENLASTIQVVKINAKTRDLLEQSQQQAEEMKAQEEEMRQNMEELLATQEEMGRKEKEMGWTMDAISGLATLVEFDFRGMITSVNSKICLLTGYSREELVGQHHSILIDTNDPASAQTYQKLWNSLKDRKPVEDTMKRLAKDGTQLTLKALCYPIFDEDGEPLKIVELGVEISDIAKK